MLDEVELVIDVDVELFLVAVLDLPSKFVADEDGDVDENASDGQEEGFVLDIGVFDKGVEVDEELHGTRRLGMGIT